MLTDPLAEKETADPVDGGDPEGAGHVTIHVTGHVTVLLQAALQLGLVHPANVVAFILNIIVVFI